MLKKGLAKAAHLWPVILLLLAGLGALFFLPQNLNNLEILKGLIRHDKERLVQLQPGSERNCQTELFYAAMSTEIAGLEGARSAWETLLACPAVYTDMLKAVYSTDKAMAEKVLKAYPEDANNYFWLGGINLQTNLKVGLDYYTQGLKLAPTNGPAWCMVGAVQKKLKDLPSAAAAFGECCVYGDPKEAGCLQAGNIYKSLGEFKNATLFYLMSQNPSTQQLGRDLEQTNPGVQK